MKFGSVIKVALLVLLGGVLIGCSTPNQEGDKKYAQECVSKAGVTGGYSLVYANDGQGQRYRVPAKAGVTPEQSSRINACIDKGKAAGAVAASAQTPSSTPVTGQAGVRACQVEYNKSVRKNRGSGVLISGGGLSLGQSILASVVTSSIGRGASSGIIQNRYKKCLVRAGASPSQIAAATPANSRSTSGRRSSTIMTGGAGYRAPEEMAGRRVRRPAPSASKTAVRSQKPKDGKLALPTQYPLMKGDAALWPTLTLEQQQRAVLFLQSGSSIRSSLAGDK